MTPIRDLIDIPERVQRDDFVLRLAEGVAQPEETLRTYVVTPQLADAFDRALSLLQNFDLGHLEAVGRKIRDLYAGGASAPTRVLERADDAYLGSLAHAVTGGLGGRIGIAPRVFLKKLVQDVLDRIDLHPDFDPRRDYALTLSDGGVDRGRAERARGPHAGRRRAGAVSRLSRIMRRRSWSLAGTPLRLVPSR